jgi:predicted phage terminase large subunit-like protein
MIDLYAEIADLTIGNLLTFNKADKSAYHASVSFADFKARAYPRFIPTAFHALLDSYLEQVELYVRTGGKQGIGRLMVFMPPRHGKSLSVSKLFPAWFIGRNPDARMIMASYGASLAKKNSRFVRNMIKGKRYQEVFPDVKLADDTASAQEWDIADHEGGAVSAGVGGGITGHGANLLIIDDPVKSRHEAESQIYRDNLVEWYGDAYTRLEEPGGAVILMHTRWHEDDLAGHLLADGTDEWTVLSLPALAESDDPIGRTEGAALWPDRYDVPKLNKIEENLGEYRFTAEYQQKPKAKAGALFDTALITVIDHLPACKAIVRFYDLAVTTKKKSDYTVGVKLGVTVDEQPIIFDVWRAQKAAPDVQDAIAQNAAIDGTDVPIRLEAEKAGIIELDYLLRDSRLHNFRIDAQPPQGDKYTRAGPFAKQVKAGRALMVRGTWNRAYLDELSMFPSGAHDDQVDATSGAWDMLGHISVSVSFVEHTALPERTADGIVIERDDNLWDLNIGGWQ